jgi:hypothetical protein
LVDVFRRWEPSYPGMRRPGAVAVRTQPERVVLVKFRKFERGRLDFEAGMGLATVCQTRKDSRLGVAE